MVQYLIAKEQLSSFIGRLMAAYRVVAPVRQGEELRFMPLGDPAEAVLSYTNTTKAPKYLFLPQTECLMRFARKAENYNEIETIPLDETPTVLLGIRPCDVQGLLLVDRVYGEGRYIDPYYQARRNHTIVLSLACDRPRANCFCHAFGSGPYDARGSDGLLRDAGDAYLLEPVTERGEQLLTPLALAEADAAHLTQAQEIEQQATTRLRQVEPVAGIEEDLDALFNSDVWNEIAEKCLGCGTCTYICSTCHCFTIEDRLLAEGGERVRGWDSCMYAVFTQHASGHNPRGNQAARWRQRLMHKFNYLPRNVGRYGCVGCGRCIQSCPVRMDIRAVLRRVRQEHREKAKA